MMKAAAWAALVLLAVPPQDLPRRERVHFNRDIRPLLWDTCLKCHGPDVEANGSDLRLDTRQGALADLGGRAAIVPGKPEKSELYLRLTTADRKDRMPPAKSGKTLTPAQIELFRRWIEEGAEYQGHWAFIPPAKTAPPAVRTAGWARTPVDAFLLARMEKEGLRPSPEADRTTLLRRLSLDLTGLAPTPEEADAFEADRDPGAYEKQVDRLLASPAYGERMAVAWLDAVRYADSRGYHSDNPRNVASYRDYVIAAFNENMPYDRFTIEQLAGDLLEGATLRQRVASGYNKLNQTTEEGGAQAKEYAAKTAADRVRNVSTVWMGATLGCAECHDHKFDPYTAKDFYRFAAFFADIQEAPIKDPDRGIPVPDDAQAATLAALDAEIDRLRKVLDTPTPELEAAQRAWETEALRAPPWTVRSPRAVTSAGGAELRVEEDASVVVVGAPAKDTHTVEIDAAAGTSAIRLDVWRDGTRRGSGPGLAPNGNFVLTQFRVKAGGKDVALARASASWEQEGWPVAAALDGKDDRGWAVLPQTGRDHEAVFWLKAPLAAGGPISLQLDYRSPFGEHVPARFRLSTSSAEPEVLAPLPAEVRRILAKPAAERAPSEASRLAAHYRSVAPRLRETRTALADAERRRADFEKTLRRSLVSMPAAPRTVRFLKRGNWMDDSGEVMSPATPGFLPPLAVGERRATRLDLARWLCSKENPLTARTFVNRLWKRFFGTGLSKVLDDLGGQGEWPSHPELLDWLAVEFMDTG
ncbi:MAG TPA: DUF1549 domain-containing protein, partial [Planctomycetota bacterium]|nr:DUF1549 domain-containing protein [Planctomycetota bacterium]